MRRQRKIAVRRLLAFGKRMLGLVVSGETGDRLAFGSALLRNGVKFVPWEFGHTVAVWWLIAMMATGRTPYDRWASARVVPSAEPVGMATASAASMP
jgi:hypothetical protein